MAIINSNPIILRDADVTLDSSFILTHDFSGSVRQVGIIKFKCQVHFFANADKWLQGIDNALRVNDFEPFFEVDYDANSDIKDMLLWFDQKLKTHLLDVYPEWDAEKLVLTTEQQL